MLGRYSPKGIFPSSNLLRVFSQVATSQRGFFPSLSLPQQSAPIAICGPNFWEGPAWEIAHLWSCHWGNCHLLSVKWKNVFVIHGCGFWKPCQKCTGCPTKYDSWGETAIEDSHWSQKQLSMISTSFGNYKMRTCFFCAYKLPEVLRIIFWKAKF